MKVFPKWSDILGINAQIIGYDAPIHAPAETYRAIVQHIIDDPMSKGALVTTHKIDLLHACRDLFDTLDPYAEICDEVSGIAYHNQTLSGHALDPITSGFALDHFIPENYWATSHADVLCFGAGGAGVAISVYMAQQTHNHPHKFILTDISQERLDAIQAIHAKLDTPVKFEYHLIDDTATNDKLLHDLPAQSLVINATGLGKDRPGSPLSDDAVFPRDGLVWELNYRGARPFMRQAQTQSNTQNLHIEDGWVYFIHGWSQVIATVFDLELTPEIMQQLDHAANQTRTT
jgi:shikimate 5-dehydrogenase